MQKYYKPMTNRIIHLWFYGIFHQWWRSVLRDQGMVAIAYSIHVAHIHDLNISHCYNLIILMQKYNFFPIWKKKLSTRAAAHGMKKSPPAENLTGGDLNVSVSGNLSSYTFTISAMVFIISLAGLIRCIAFFFPKAHLSIILSCSTFL